MFAIFLAFASLLAAPAPSQAQSPYGCDRLYESCTSDPLWLGPWILGHLHEEKVYDHFCSDAESYMSTVSCYRGVSKFCDPGNENHLPTVSNTYFVHQDHCENPNVNRTSVMEAAKDQETRYCVSAANIALTTQRTIAPNATEAQRNMWECDNHNDRIDCYMTTLKKLDETTWGNLSKIAEKALPEICLDV
ncbi:uncharacterized protein LOC106012255 [Aplysia californica]|uniref:Uncharacterized protein LOC106012255 n=1 Tax=Aplysia californica TaxID=6500 RepID=A0ABM1A3H8_APLCA|nr:uncharacterized protein LOC106012255 [Aplysia californica]